MSTPTMQGLADTDRHGSDHPDCEGAPTPNTAAGVRATVEASDETRNEGGQHG